jgi:hypothetical protein
MNKNYLQDKKIYGNWEVYHPEGFLMFRCDDKKANWYLERNLAVAFDENKVRLSFIPKGNGHTNEPFYLVAKENRCVICGTEKELTRHHAVPYCFRRHFNDGLKSKSSHDVVPLCITCHRSYEPHAWELKKKLAAQYGVAMEGVNEKVTEEDKDRAKAVGCANTLLRWKEQIPSERRLELLETLEGFVGKKKEEIQDGDLRAFFDKNKKAKLTKEYKFGKEIVVKIEDMPAFIRMWRIHFIDTMQPKFMPELWDINHRLSNVEESKT